MRCFSWSVRGIREIWQLRRWSRRYCSIGSTFQRAAVFAKKSDDEVRWATLNTMAIVRRHGGLVDELARMMGTGESTAKLISIIEARLANADEKDI